MRTFDAQLVPLLRLAALLQFTTQGLEVETTFLRHSCGYKYLLVFNWNYANYDNCCMYRYSAGYTEDLRRTLNHVHDRFTGVPVTLVGFSLGANVVAKYCINRTCINWSSAFESTKLFLTFRYVGEEREGCRLAGAVALAAPIDCIS